MKQEKLNYKKLTGKNCDDWFNILKGKKITGAHQEIQHDANILRDFFAEYEEEKKQQRKEKRQQWLAAYLKPQPVFATLFLAITGFVVFTMIPIDKKSIGEPEAFTSEKESQSGLIRAFNAPKAIDNVENHIAQISQVFSDLNVEDDEYKEGIMVRILIKNQPNPALLKKLQTYGFGTELGKQYLYLKEK